MKSVKKSVKSDGKVLGEIEVLQFETLAEAGKEITEVKAVSLLNRQYLSDSMNEFRASQTREISPIAKLNKIAKTNPALQKQLEALIAKFGGVVPPTVPPATTDAK